MFSLIGEFDWICSNYFRLACTYVFFICFHRQLIYNYPEQLFADANIMAIEHADFDGVERLALVTGGEIVSTFDDPDRVKLGQCDLIEEVSKFPSMKRTGIL